MELYEVVIGRARLPVPCDGVADICASRSVASLFICSESVCVCTIVRLTPPALTYTIYSI